MISLAVFVTFAAWIGWMLRYRREPLVYLVPLALTFAPLMWYASSALGWPTGWLSTRAALVGCIALFVMHRIASGDFAWRAISGYWFVWPYLTLVTASVIWVSLGVGAADVAQVANEFVTWILPVCVFLALAGSPLFETDVAVASRTLLFTVVVAAALALTQVMFFTGRDSLIPGPLVQLARQVADDTWFGSFRVYGTFPTIGPNMFGVFLVIPTMILLSRAAGASGGGRWGWGLGGLLSVAMIGATLSRGAQLGLLVALALLPFWRRSWRTGVAVIGLAGLAVIVAAGTGVSQHALRLFSGGQLDVDALERVNIWHTILGNAPGHPFGYGFNGWLRVSGNLIEAAVADGANAFGSSYPAENQWFRELADRGILGVVALAVLVGGLLVVTYRSSNAETPSGRQRDFMAGAGAGIAGFSVAMLTGDHLSYDSVAGMFWFIAALVLSSARTSEGNGPMGSGRLECPTASISGG